MNETSITSGSNSYTAQRILAAIVALPLTVFALLVILNQLRVGFDLIGAIFGSGAGMTAIICWWFALRGHIAEIRVRIRFAVVGGLVIGGIGFAAGFFGPIILTPRANQGPLLGILVTGPLGFVLGAVIGWLYGRFRTPGPRSG
jgi:hypothetical protein